MVLWIRTKVTMTHSAAGAKNETQNELKNLLHFQGDL